MKLIPKSVIFVRTKHESIHKKNTMGGQILLTMRATKRNHESHSAETKSLDPVSPDPVQLTASAVVHTLHRCTLLAHKSCQGSLSAHMDLGVRMQAFENTNNSNNESSASKFINWLMSRANPETPMSVNDISNAISSRRNAKKVILAALRLGFLQQINDKYISKNIQNNTKIPVFHTAGQVDLPGTTAPTVPPSMSCLPSSSKCRNEPQNLTPQIDLAQLQHKNIFSKSSYFSSQSKSLLPSGPHRGPSINKNISEEIPKVSPEDNLFINTQTLSIINISTKNKIRSGSDARSIFDAKSENQTKIKKSTNTSTPSYLKKIAVKENKKAIRFRELEQRTQQMRSVISSTKLNSSETSNLLILESKAYGIALAYEELLGIYLHKPTLKYLKNGMKSTSRHFSRWLLAADQAVLLSADYHKFIKSQFWWFDQTFSRFPKVYELSGGKGLVPAAERYRLFLAAISAGKINENAKILSKVVATIDATTRTGTAKNSQITAPESVRFSNSERSLRQFMKNKNAPAEWVFLNYAKGPMASQYFDLQWLKKHPVYLRLRANGEL